MSSPQPPSTSRRIVAATSAAPPVLLAYIAFAISVSLIDFLLLPLAPESFRIGLNPYTGWLVSGVYFGTVAFAIALVYERRWRQVLRFGLVAQLCLSIGLGLFQAAQVGREDFGNPYLTISPWQPLWTVLLPALWIAALYTSGMNRHCRESQQPRAV